MPEHFPYGMRFRTDGTGTIFDKGESVDYGQRFDWNVPTDGSLELTRLDEEGDFTQTLRYKINAGGKRLDFLDGSPGLYVPRTLIRR